MATMTTRMRFLVTIFVAGFMSVNALSLSTFATRISKESAVKSPLFRQAAPSSATRRNDAVLLQPPVAAGLQKHVRRALALTAAAVVWRGAHVPEAYAKPKTSREPPTTRVVKSSRMKTAPKEKNGSDKKRLVTADSAGTLFLSIGAGVVLGSQIVKGKNERKASKKSDVDAATDEERQRNRHEAQKILERIEQEREEAQKLDASKLRANAQEETRKILERIRLEREQKKAILDPESPSGSFVQPRPSNGQEKSGVEWVADKLSTSEIVNSLIEKPESIDFKGKPSKSGATMEAKSVESQQKVASSLSADAKTQSADFKKETVTEMNVHGSSVTEKSKPVAKAETTPLDTSAEGTNLKKTSDVSSNVAENPALSIEMRTETVPEKPSAVETKLTPSSDAKAEEKAVDASVDTTSKSQASTKEVQGITLDEKKPVESPPAEVVKSQSPTKSQVKPADTVSVQATSKTLSVTAETSQPSPVQSDPASKVNSPSKKSETTNGKEDKSSVVNAPTYNKKETVSIQQDSPTKAIPQPKTLATKNESSFDEESRAAESSKLSAKSPIADKASEIANEKSAKVGTNSQLPKKQQDELSTGKSKVSNINSATPTTKDKTSTAPSKAAQPVTSKLESKSDVPPNDTATPVSPRKQLDETAVGPVKKNWRPLRSRKYESIDSVEEKAFTILKDLGMIEQHPDPNSSNYDSSKDDEFVE